ncbi:MAG TPA: hypothetical protein G4O12_08990 [Dehalococcoidia bacterium]|nr:hypothetical protein [Dehalococcoidia bacterium]
MKRTWKPTTAGVLNIISGIFLFIGGISVLGLLGQPMAASWANYVMYSVELSGAPSMSFVTTIIVILATALIVPGVLSILGGICSVKRSVWGMALAGSISTLLSVTFLGIPAIILTVVSRREFGQQ